MDTEEKRLISKMIDFMGVIKADILELKHDNVRLEEHINLLRKHAGVNKIKVNIKKLHEDAVIPEQATKGSAGFDLRAYIEETKSALSDTPQMGLPSTSVTSLPYIDLAPNEKVRVNTGLAFSLPDNYVMIIAPRSSSGIKKDLILQNTIGVLDSDYRGECFLFLKNIGKETIRIEHGERIAQVLILPYPDVTFTEVDDLDSTERGEGGFGSSGRF